MTSRQRLKRLKELAEFGGMDALYDYTMSLEREVEAYRRAEEKRRAPLPSQPASEPSSATGPHGDEASASAKKSDPQSTRAAPGDAQGAGEPDALALLDEMFEAFVVDNVEMTPWQIETMQKVRKVLAPRWRISRKLARAAAPAATRKEDDRG